MENPEINRLEDGTIVLKIKVSHAEVEKVREKVKAELSKQVNAPGFRKGNVPKKIAEERLNKALVQEETLKQVVPDAYNEAIKKLDVHPIISPKLHIELFDEGTDLQFEAVTAEEPKVTLKKYKEAVQKITAGTKILKPGEEPKKPSIDEVLEAALSEAEVLVPKILVEEETNRLLSQVLDELQRLGMTLDQYLASRGQKVEDLRGAYEAKSERDLKMEFVLKAIADQENIKIEEKDLEEALSRFKDEKNRADIAKNPYFLTALIRQQKTIDFLMKI
jgi:FKBP-type peptidyl-prolyl cis-trans isomerase (trigger factor)